MATMTIRKIDDDTKARIKKLSIKHGHSMEEIARQILRTGSLVADSDEYGWATKLKQYYVSLKIEDNEKFVIPSRNDDTEREPIDFSDPKYGIFDEQS